MSRPVPRWTYVVGRFLSVAVFLLVSGVFFGLSLGALAYVSGAEHWGVALAAPVYSVFESWIVSALAIVLIQESSATVSSVVVVMLFIIGRLSRALHDAIPALPRGVAELVRFVWRIVPDLAAFDLVPLAHGAPVDPLQLASNAAIGLLMVASLLIFATIRIDRRTSI